VRPTASPAFQLSAFEATIRFRFRAMISAVVFSEAYPDGEKVGDVVWGKS